MEKAIANLENRLTANLVANLSPIVEKAVSEGIKNTNAKADKANANMSDKAKSDVAKVIICLSFFLKYVSNLIDELRFVGTSPTSA